MSDYTSMLQYYWESMQKSTCNKELVNNSKVVKGLTPPLQNDYYKNKVSEIFALSPDNIKKHMKLTDNITVSDLLDMYGMFLTGGVDPQHVKNRDYPEYRRLINKQNQVKSIWKNFFLIMDMPVNMITNFNMRQWAIFHKEQFTLKNSTVNRLTSNLRGMLTWGYKNGILRNKMLSDFELLAVNDQNRGVRSLSDKEIRSLISALERREITKRQKRESCNKHRLAHNLRPLPDYPPIETSFVDYAYPMIAVSLLTGARKGSVRGLKWKDIDLKNNLVIYQAENFKTGISIFSPISASLKKILNKWKTQNQISDSHIDQNKYVFSCNEGRTPISASAPYCWKDILSEAGITSFRWHDLRHTFASTLVQNGVDIYTLKSLLGHSSITTTAKYLHTTSKDMKNAVKIIERAAFIK